LGIGAQLAQIDRLAEELAVELLARLIDAGDFHRRWIFDDQAVAIGNVGVARVGRMRRIGTVVERRFAVDEIDPPLDLRLFSRHLPNKMQGPGFVLVEAEYAKSRGLALDPASLLVARDSSFLTTCSDLNARRTRRLRPNEERARMVTNARDADCGVNLVHS